MGHTHSSILVHVVFTTKGRRNLIAKALRQRLHRYMGGVARAEFGRALKIGGTDNHVHGLLSLSPSVSVAEAMRKWKSLSSRWVHETFPAQADFAWQTGAGALPPVGHVTGRGGPSPPEPFPIPVVQGPLGLRTGRRQPKAKLRPG